MARRARLGDARGDGRSARRRRRSADANPHEDVRYGGGGRYTEIDPPNRLAFTWVWDDDEDGVEQLIEVDFVEADGATTITFTHSGLWDDEVPAFLRGRLGQVLRQPRARARVLMNASEVPTGA